MTITQEQAETVLDMFGYVHGEGGLSDAAHELVEAIFAAFPALRDRQGDDGRPVYAFLLS